MDNSVNVTITGNATSAISGNANQASWSVSGNAFIQNTNPNGVGYYGDVFVTSSLAADATGAHNFVANPSGMLSTLGAGAGASGYTPALPPTTTAPVVVPPTSRAGGHNRTSRAGGHNRARRAGGHRPRQTSRRTQPRQKSRRTQPPPEEPTVVQPPSDGATGSATGDSGAVGPQALTFDQSNGGFNGYASGKQTTYQMDDTALTSSATGSALKLGGTGTVAEVPHHALGAIFETDTFSIDFSLAGTAGNGQLGEIFRAHTVLMAHVTEVGEFMFQLYDQNYNLTRVVAKGVNINDGASHDVSVTLADGQLTVSIDGVVAGQAAFSGTTPIDMGYDLMFGNPWGGANFSASLTAFDVARTASDYAVDLTPDPTPADPVDTATPAEPVDTATPTEPVDTATPAEPVDTTTPAEPVDTTTPTVPVDTATPAEPVDITAPTVPVDTTHRPSRAGGTLQQRQLDRLEKRGRRNRRSCAFEAAYGVG